MPRLQETINDSGAALMHSLCTVNGSLYISTDKASLICLIEEANPQPQLETPSATGNLHQILVINTIWLSFKVTITTTTTTTTTTIIFCIKFCVYDLHTGRKETSTLLNISDLQESFIKHIERMVSGFDEGRIVFDRYLEEQAP